MRDLKISEGKQTVFYQYALINVVSLQQRRLMITLIIIASVSPVLQIMILFAFKLTGDVAYTTGHLCSESFPQMAFF